MGHHLQVTTVASAKILEMDMSFVCHFCHPDITTMKLEQRAQFAVECTLHFLCNRLHIHLRPNSFMVFSFTCRLALVFKAAIFL